MTRYERLQLPDLPLIVRVGLAGLEVSPGFQALSGRLLEQTHVRNRRKYPGADVSRAQVINSSCFEGLAESARRRRGIDNTLQEKPARVAMCIDRYVAIEKLGSGAALLRGQYHAEIGQWRAVADSRGGGALRMRDIDAERGCCRGSRDATQSFSASQRSNWGKVQFRVHRVAEPRYCGN